MSDSLPPPRYTLWQSLAVAVSLATRAIEEVRALKNTPATAGKFPAVAVWKDGIYYEGAVVAHNGATWQATRDTAREPPHEDWALLAAPGAAGPEGYAGEVRGLWQSDGAYRKGDLVALNGSEWRARHDDPGRLPGDGWALSGKRGAKGERGDPGPAGKPGADLAGWVVDGYRITPIMTDGRAGPPLDLAALFEQYHAESR